MIRVKILLLLIPFLFSSCGENEKLVLNQISEKDKHFIDESTVTDIAMLIGTSSGNTIRRSVAYKSLDILNIIPIGDVSNPTAYIVNYKDNRGYVILAADDRVDPVLAFSNQDNFELNYSEMPPILIDWVNDTDIEIQNIRSINKPDTISSDSRVRHNKRLISNVQAFFNLESPREEFEDPIWNQLLCECKHEEYGPLLKTQWHQDYPYNSQIPKTCGTNNAPAGCVPIALAQIVRYYEYPNEYNWDKMNSPYLYDDASKLIRLLGVMVGIDYGCDGSGANTGNVIPALKDHLKYKEAKYAGYDYVKVKYEIRNNYPVIFSGKKGFLRGGHAWVCDGYKEDTFCDLCAHRAGALGSTKLFLHMNWGWGASYNGWFGFQDWKEYNSQQKMVYNIRSRI